VFFENFAEFTLGTVRKIDLELLVQEQKWKIGEKGKEFRGGGAGRENSGERGELLVYHFF
jgi:hypothetical protein